MAASNFFLAVDDGVMKEIFLFVGPGHYRYIAVNKRFRQCYRNLFGTKVYIRNAVASISCAQIAVREATKLLSLSWSHWRNGRQDPRAKICPLAAGEGRLDVIKWGRSVGLSWEDVLDDCTYEFDFPENWKNCVWNDGTCEAAARNGHLNVIIWARDHSCPWDGKTCAAAALKGHVDIVKWAHENGCPWNNTTCSAAAFGGHLEVLGYARQHACPWDKNTCKMASKYGHFAVLRWAVEQGCDWRKHDTCNDAARHGNLEMLEFALEKGCPFTRTIYRDAAMYAHLNILEWGIQRGDIDFGAPYAGQICETAAANGRVSVLRWAHVNGFHNWHSSIWIIAAAYGHLNILMWAYENGFRCGAETCTEAARAGHLEVLEWLTAYGCPWEDKILVAATKNACNQPSFLRTNSLNLLKWVLEKGRQKHCDSRVIDHCIAYASGMNKADVLTVLFRHAPADSKDRHAPSKRHATFRDEYHVCHHCNRQDEHGPCDLCYSKRRNKGA